MVDSKNALTITQFAKEVGISRQAVFKLIESNAIQNKDKVGNIWLIDKSEITKYHKNKK